jgi:hypothetical protein
MIYNLSTIINDTIKKTNKNSPNKIELPDSLTNKKPQELKKLTIDVALANQKSFDLYNKYTNYNYNVNTKNKPKHNFSVFDIINEQKLEENVDKKQETDKQETDKQETYKQETDKQDIEQDIEQGLKQEKGKKQDLQIFQKSIKKNGLFIVGCFCLFLASFNYFHNFKYFFSYKK